METASTCHSILSKYTSNSLEGLDVNQILKLTHYEQVEEARIKAEQEAK